MACIVRPIPRKQADGSIELQSISAILTIAKSHWLGDEKWQARGLLSLVVLFLLAYTGLSVVLNNKGKFSAFQRRTSHDSGKPYRFIVLVLYAPPWLSIFTRSSQSAMAALAHPSIRRQLLSRSLLLSNTSNTDIDNPISASPKMSAVLPKNH